MRSNLTVSSNLNLKILKFLRRTLYKYWHWIWLHKGQSPNLFREKVKSWNYEPKVIRIPMFSLSWNKFWNKFKSIGIFFPYIKESLDVNNTTTSLIFSIMMFFQYCGSLIGRDSNINYYQSDWFNPKDSDYSSLIESVINYLS